MRNFFRSICGFGLILGALLFAASLTPSLIPRNQVVQGVLSGFAFGAGYGIGVVLRSVYRYLELPGLSSASLRVVRPVAIVACLGLMATAPYHVKTWQNAYWQAVSTLSASGFHGGRCSAGGISYHHVNQWCFG